MSNAAPRTPTPGMTITIEFVEGDTDRSDRLANTTHEPAAFERILAQISAAAPAGGAYDKTAVVLRWRADRISSLAAPGSKLELGLQLDVTRDFGSLAAYLQSTANWYLHVALHGRDPEGTVHAWLSFETAEERAAYYAEALTALTASAA